MKIGIVTVQKSRNFGANLQAYALQKKLELMGYDAEIIDYLYYKHPDFNYTAKARPVWKIGIKKTVVEFVKYRILNRILYKVIPLFSTDQRKQNESFEHFYEKHMKMSKTYFSIDELYNAKMKYDTYIVGSDQVWNPNTGSNISPYFLTFAPKNAKKVAYASSFGVSSLDESLKSLYVKWLNNLDTISVRESTGVSLVKGLVHREATHVLDPTLLMTRDEWDSLVTDIDITPGYVLIYETYQSKKILDIARKYAKQNNVPIYRIELRAIFNHKDDGILSLNGCGPIEFVSLIKNAGLVLTSSFHGTAFSVIYNKKFVVVLNEEKSNNSRIESLLELLKLKQLIVYEGENTNNTEYCYYDEIQVNTILDLQRQISINYLISALH